MQKQEHYFFAVVASDNLVSRQAEMEAEKMRYRDALMGHNVPEGPYGLTNSVYPSNSGVYVVDDFQSGRMQPQDSQRSHHSYLVSLAGLPSRWCFM